jgi:hypothetical protein
MINQTVAAMDGSAWLRKAARIDNATLRKIAN